MRRFLFAWIIIVIALAVVGFVHGQPALHQDVGGGTALEGPDSPERAGIGHRPLDFFRLSPRGPSTVIKNRRLWINAGLGPGSIENALHFGLSFSYHHAKKHLISARFIYSTTIDIGLGGLGNDRPDEQIWEIGVLYGKAIRWEAGLASISAGLGKITGIRQGRLIRTHPLGGIFSGGSINIRRTVFQYHWYPG